MIHYVSDKRSPAPRRPKLKRGLVSLSALLKHSCKLQSWTNKSAVPPLMCERGRDYCRVHEVHTVLPVAVDLPLQQHGNMSGMLAV